MYAKIAIPSGTPRLPKAVAVAISPEGNHCAAKFGGVASTVIWQVPITSWPMYATKNRLGATDNPLIHEPTAVSTADTTQKFRKFPLFMM